MEAYGTPLLLFREWHRSLGNIRAWWVQEVSVPMLWMELTSLVWTFSFPDCEGINSHCLKLPTLWSSVPVVPGILYANKSYGPLSLFMLFQRFAWTQTSCACSGFPFYIIHFNSGNSWTREESLNSWCFLLHLLVSLLGQGFTPWVWHALCLCRQGLWKITQICFTTEDSYFGTR